MSALLRGIVFLIFGPLIGESLFFLMGSGQVALALMVPFIFLVPAYMVGTIPALISAVLVGGLRWRGFSHRRTLIWAAVIGAISTCLPLSAASLFVEIKPSITLLIFVIVGSLTCTICEFFVIVLTNPNFELGRPFSLKETQFALRPDVVFRPTSLSEMRVPVILGLLGLAPIAALWIVLITKPEQSYPRLVSDIRNIRGSWARPEDNKTIDFSPDYLADQLGNVTHSGVRHYRTTSGQLTQRVGDQFRYRSFEGFRFQIGPNPTTGTPRLEKVWETCLVRIWQQSAKKLFIEVDSGNSDPCLWFGGTFTKP